MEELSTKTLELSPQTLSSQTLSPQTEAEGKNIFNAARAKLYYGNYAYYLEKKSRENEENDANSAELKVIKNELSLSSADRRVMEKQKQSVMRKLEKQEAFILKELEELEKKKTYLEVELALPDVYTNGDKTKEVKNALFKCVKEIEAKTHEWESAVKELEGAR
jgi:ATP-binding cassette subfamily F protein 3